MYWGKWRFDKSFGVTCIHISSQMCMMYEKIGITPPPPRNMQIKHWNFAYIDAWMIILHIHTTNIFRWFLMGCKTLTLQTFIGDHMETKSISYYQCVLMTKWSICFSYINYDIPQRSGWAEHYKSSKSFSWNIMIHSDCHHWNR